MKEKKIRSGWKDKEGAKEMVVNGTSAFQHVRMEKTLLLLVDIPMMPSNFDHDQQ